MRLLAYMLRRGDLVDDGREQREVKAVRQDERGVIVLFKTGQAMRVGRNDTLPVRRGWAASRRERGR